MSLTPAYGRDYKPMNINQTAPGDSFEVRYSNLRKVAVVVGGAA